MSSIVRTALAEAQNPRNSRWVSRLLLVADAALCGLVIWKVPYTEIDWRTYMEHIELYISGERDYAKIEGGTGPLVYPGLHVYIYRALYSLTNHGTDIRLAQIIFSGVYLTTLAVVMGIYRMANAPPYLLPLLVLSKRLHSIYMLRCFNDCFAALGLYTAIYLYQRRQWSFGSIAYTCGLGVKMSMLLPLPSILMIFLQALGKDRTVTQVLLIAQMQIMFGYPFARAQPLSYLTRSFDFSRAFLHKWTVNWRFIPPSIFLSRPFALSLLALHISLLAVFAYTRWTRPSRRSLPDLLKLVLLTTALQSEDVVDEQIAPRVTPAFIATTILGANAIGALCARSLHYQFFAWIAWGTPLLLWRAGLGPVGTVLVWAAQEWGWNTFPSTNGSAAVVVAALAVQVGGVWWGTRLDGIEREGEKKEVGHEHEE
ncbi:glycosyltransferase [Lineolata rhizophorae]|uniref:Dol-P-Man:Man(5)GlcNAc(2)-PP-Dol alpha-1,3-mannosyltransferase n=1 Tax=Lineolata rhizophorae TaxID=578093 RepID=A0A6A6P604_9PEZI|nr:glycosyltransferase [Lineolata rhizophorae]